MFIQVTVDPTDPVCRVNNEIIINTNKIELLIIEKYTVYFDRGSYKLTEESFNYLIKELGVLKGV